MPQREAARTNGRGGDGDGDQRGSPSRRIAEDEVEEAEEEEEEEDRSRRKRTIGRAMRSLSRKIYGRRRRKEKPAQPPPAPAPASAAPAPPPRRSAPPDFGGDGGYRCSSCICFNPNPSRYPPDSPLIAPNPSGNDPKVTKKPTTYHEFVRSLLESNDFYSRDCNVHRDTSSDSDDP